MLEKIGLPAKPSLRGNNWVVDATHCQGCSSQFTFINRKHHCRRCGGLFCNSCTQQRMVLRGQGDWPVRICEPCKKLEEAARFEMRYGHKNRAGRGNSRLTSRNEDELLSQILGNDGKESSSSGQQSNSDMLSTFQRASSSASCTTTLEVAALDGGGEICRSHSVDEPIYLQSEIGSTSPEEIRQRALDEKKRYKILKGEGKSEEALKAFKRGKELERQADALELSIRKNRRKVLSSGNMTEIQDKDGLKESGRKSKLLAQVGKEKDDLTAELRDLGWSDMDLHDGDKKPANMSLEGELSSILGDISQQTDNDTKSHGIDKSQVVAHKRKALSLKREGKLAEAKEELKKAKILEKQLEEQAILGVAEDSDDEISVLIRSMDSDRQDELLVGYEQEHGFNFDHLMGTSDDLGIDGGLEATDADLLDPEIAATLKSLGWTDESDNLENIVAQTVPIDGEALRSEIHFLKREALNKKRAGNVAEAMALLKKAKLLEKDLESFEGEADNLITHNHTIIQEGSTSQNADPKNDAVSKLAPKSRLTIQKELLALKKKALALRREGRLDEAEEELKKGRVLEHQLEEMDSTSKAKATQSTVGNKDSDVVYEKSDISINPPVGEEGDEDVTDQDMHDPTYILLLRNLGWKDEDNELGNSVLKAVKENDNHAAITEHSITKATSNIPVRTSRRSKAEIQRELLGLKRKALNLRREGKTDESEEVLRTAKVLEAQMAEMETPKNEIQFESNRPKDEIIRPLNSVAEEGDAEDVTEKDMHNPQLLSMLHNLGWKDNEPEPVTTQGKSFKQVSASSVHSTEPSVIPTGPSISVVTPRSRAEIQRELLGLKRKALALRRKGETEEAQELLQMAKALEIQMEELEGPKKELLSDASKDVKSGSPDSLINHENQSNAKNAVEINEKSAATLVHLNDEVVESFMDIQRKESDATAPPLRRPDSSIPVTSHLIEDNYPLLGDLGSLGEMNFPANAGTNQVIGFITPPQQSVNVMDLLTGDDWISQTPAKPEDKVNSCLDISDLREPPVHLGSMTNLLESVRNKEDKANFSSDVSCLSERNDHVSSLTSHPQNLRSKEDIPTEAKEETVNTSKKPHTNESNSVQGLASQNNQNSLRQEVLAHKRKAVALKREGKLTEAREQLRQAKLLEKSLEERAPEPETDMHNVSTSLSNVAPAPPKETGVSNLASKPLSGSDRFRLQQESLSHKRQALKLRREGRMEEAEAKFELAKALEAQLEELASQDSTKSSVSVAEPVDVVVEDLLDPQLLSALKAIGIEDAKIVSQGPEKPGPVKVNPASENYGQERIQLEERIKAEKLKAVNLKRSGKQAEALDALRRAKLFEKKLNSLVSN